VTGSRGRYSLAFVAAFLGMVGLVLWWNAVLDIRAFHAHQTEIAQQSVNGAGNEITLLIEGLQTSVQLMMNGYPELLQELAQNPEDMEVHARIAGVLERYFPEYYAFTIADAGGELLYDDFGERIGDLCAADLKSFAVNHHPADIYIHPGPSEYHFDIAQPWYSGARQSGIFFVSFRAESIARLLRDSEPPRPPADPVA